MAIGQNCLSNALVIWLLKQILLKIVIYLKTIVEKTCHIDSNEYGKPFYNIRASKEHSEKFVYPIDTIVDITCDSGYEVLGTSRVSCMNGDMEGDWSSSLPICKKGKKFINLKYIEAIIF